MSHRLDLVFTLDQQVQQLLGVDSGLPVVGHQPDEGCVPLVGNLGEGGAATAHQHLPDAVLKLLEGLIIHPQEGLQAADMNQLSVLQECSSLYRSCVYFATFQGLVVALWPGKTQIVKRPSASSKSSTQQSRAVLDNQATYQHTNSAKCTGS